MTHTEKANTVCEVTLSYINKTPAKSRIKVTQSSHAADSMRHRFESFIEHHEEFHILLLNKANQVLGSCKVGQGGLDSCPVDQRCIFQAALLANASAMILFHNHPSGNLRASDSDIQLTKKIIAGGNLLSISVLDHIILTSDGYLSLSDEGFL